jgi:sugar phosphate isomerase/epimerase
MDIDFGAMIDALRKINYRGYLTLEADNYLKDRTAENMFEGIQNLAAAARRLSDMFGEF